MMMTNMTGAKKSSPICILNNNEQDDISDCNSIATANKPNVDMKSKGNRTDGVIHQATGLEPNTVTPSKSIQDGQQV